MSTPSTAERRGRLTVAILAQDSQQHLAQTLDCVAGRADEVFVLDPSGSHETASVARERGAILLEQPWDESFSVARNFCLDRASGDWVLWLDAGETFSAEDIGAILKFVRTEAKPTTAYLLLVETPPSEESPFVERVGQIRLVPRRQGLAFEGRVHERLDTSLGQLGMTTRPLPQVIRRTTIGSEARRAAAYRDLKLAKLELAEGCDAPRVLVAAGTAEAILGQAENAAIYFRRAIDSGTPGSSDVLDAYYGLLTTQDNQPDQGEHQIAICLQALENYPLDAQLLYGMSSYMLKQNRLDLASRAFRVAAEHGHTDPATRHIVDIEQTATICLSLALQLQGDEKEAEKVLGTALAGRPDSSQLRHQLLQLYVKRGNSGAALATFDRLPRDIPHREALRSAVRGGSLAAQKNWTAAAPYLQTAYSAGCRDPLCLRYLASTHLAVGNTPSALAVLREWQALEPHSAEVAAQIATLVGQGTTRSVGTEFEEPQQPNAAAAPTQVSRIDPGSQPPGAGLPARPTAPSPSAHHPPPAPV